MMKNFVFGDVGLTPLLGDWNGDGMTEAGVFKDGNWLLDYEGSWGWSDDDKNFIVGSPGGIPVIGD